MDIYQFVPLFGVNPYHISIALAVVVLDTAPPGYLKVPPDQATDLLGVPSLVNININDETEPTFANENVHEPVNVAVKTVPRPKSIVADVPVLPIAYAVSTIRFVFIVLDDVISLCETLFADPKPNVSAEIVALETADSLPA